MRCASWRRRSSSVVRAPPGAALIPERAGNDRHRAAPPLRPPTSYTESRCPPTPRGAGSAGILVLSASDSISTLLEVPGSEAAGWGFLSKNSSLSASALVYAIRAVAAGRTVLDPAIRAQREIRRNSPLTRLSRRQREVVALVAEGVTNAAIAARLGISPRSVDTHLNAAYGLLGIPASRERNPRVEAVRSYLQHTTSPWTSAG